MMQQVVPLKSNPLNKFPPRPLPLLFHFHGPDKKFKGVGERKRAELVAKVADGSMPVHQLPLCSYEHSAWHAIKLFQNDGGKEKEIFVISHEDPELLIADLALAISALPQNASKSLLLQRTNILCHEDPNTAAFKAIMAQLCGLYIRACRNISALCSGVASSTVLRTV
jgi:hypothetical protein